MSGRVLRILGRITAYVVGRACSVVLVIRIVRQTGILVFIIIALVNPVVSRINFILFFGAL